MLTEWLLFLFFAASRAQPLTKPGLPWPLPLRWVPSSVLYTIDPDDFHFIGPGNKEECDVLDHAFTRYRDLIFGNPKARPNPDLTAITSLLVKVNESCEKRLRFNRDANYEAYRLRITANGPSYIEAETVWGALRGLETFSQLVWESEHTLIVNETDIEDRPRFPHRGLLLDTSRHFLPVPLLKKALDGMAYNKFNVFHWHIVDDQSFPYESRTFPRLSEMGSFSSAFVYSQEDVADIIEYSRVRGIRVIAEFDTPGHTLSWGKAHPELLTPCDNSFDKRENIDPTNEYTYEFMRRFFSEIKSVFPDEYVHLGMDEITYSCWKSSPALAAFMKARGLTKLSQVEQYYVRRHAAIIADLGLKSIAWQDPIDEGVELPEDTLVTVWKDEPNWPAVYKPWRQYMSKVLSRNYSALLSACWYLNKISYGEDWKRYYTCDPLDVPDVTDRQLELILGGEAAMWGEYVDATNLLPRLFPRASAVAEVLWTILPTGRKFVPRIAEERLEQQRCRMLRRGIAAQPIKPGFCGDWELEVLTNDVGHNTISRLFKRFIHFWN